MSCIVTNFKKKFNIADNVNNINLSKLPIQKVVEIRSYVDQANLEIAQEGFRETVFEFGVRETKASSKHASHRDNYDRTEFLKINQENAMEFTEHRLQEDYNEAMLAEERIILAAESLSTFEQDDIASNQLLRQQDGSQSLYAYSVVDDSQELNLNNATFYEWKQSLLTVKENLEGLIDRYSRLKDTAKLKEIYANIAEIDKNLVELDIGDPEIIYESSMKEIQIISDFLDHIFENPEDGAQALDSFQLIDRIANLQLYFNGVDPATGASYKFEEFNDKGNPVADFYFSFQEGLDPVKSAKVKERVRDLSDKYDRTKTSVVLGILHNDTMVQHLMEMGKLDNLGHVENTGKKFGWDSKDLQDALDIISRGDIEIDQMAKLFLGGSSGGGILGQLLKGLRDSQLSRERGHTQESLGKLHKAWEAIKDKFDHDEKQIKNYVVNKLFKKDKFGKRTRELVQRYTDEFYSKEKDVRAERGQFYQNMTDPNYKSWMDSDKENFQRINPMLLSAVASKYKDHKFFGKHFTYSEAEIAQYEAGLRETLGEVMFNIEIKKAAEMIDDFVNTSKLEVLTAEQEFRRDPFEFTKHYNSTEYANAKGGWFMEPNFTHKIPRTEKGFYNDDFLAIEQGELSSELSEFYTEAYSLLTEYINPIFRSEGVYRSALELMTHEDMLERESMKTKAWYGKLPRGIAALWANQRARYYDSAITTQTRQLQQAKEGVFEKKLQVGYVGYAKQEHNVLKRIFEGNSTRDLYKQAREMGYDVSKFPIEEATESFRRFKEELSDSMAREQLNENTSTNIFESIRNASFLANDISARRSSVATLEAMKSYIGTVKEDLNKGIDAPVNIAEFMVSWGDSNIYGYKYSRDKVSDKGIGYVSSFGRASLTPLGIPKFLNEAEKKVREFINKEKDANNNGKDSYNFTHEGVKYVTDENGVFFIEEKGLKVKTVPYITIQEAYGTYLQEKIDALGVDPTVAGTALGIMSNIILSQLGINPRGGIRNRFQGISQTIATAASKRYGFDMDHYHMSRGFLRGTNTRKYIANKQFKKTKRGQNVETTKMFQEAMQLHQNRADELALEGKFDKVSGGLVDKIGTFWMDFSINNPEWHNQTELMLSILQVTPVIDKNGNERMFFDGKTQEFIYEAGTMNLKEEFDTQENRDMWVDFKESTDLNKKDSLFAVSKIKHAIHQTQGNYDNTDIIMIQNSVRGKISTMYQRYFFENTNMQWGKHKIELRSGEFNIKGRKVVLMEHAPTATAYLLGQHGLQVITGMAIGMAILPFIVASASVATMVGIALYRRNLKLKTFTAKSELGLAVDFAREAALRTINTPISMITYGQTSPFKKTIDKLNSSERSKKRNLTHSERLILSESAQDLATKAHNYATFTLAALTAKLIWMVVKSNLLGWDDDDEEEDKGLARKVIETITDIEGFMNGLINDRNTLTLETEKFTNPSAFFDEAASVSYWKTLNRYVEYLKKDVPDVLKGEKDIDGDFVYKTLANTPFFVKPNHLSKSVLSSDKGMFTDNRVYAGMTELDKKVTEWPSMLTENTAKAEISRRKARIVRDYDKVVSKRIERDYPNLTSKEFEKVLNSYRYQYFKGIKKGILDDSYKIILEHTNWKELEEGYKKDYSKEESE